MGGKQKPHWIELRFSNLHRWSLLDTGGLVRMQSKPDVSLYFIRRRWRAAGLQRSRYPRLPLELWSALPAKAWGSASVRAGSIAESLTDHPGSPPSMRTRSSASSHGRNCHSTSAALTRTGNEEASSAARNLLPGHLSSRAKPPPEHPQQGADALSCHAMAAWSNVSTQRMPSSTTGPAGYAAKATFMWTLLHYLHRGPSARGSRAFTMDDVQCSDVAVL